MTPQVASTSLAAPTATAVNIPTTAETVLATLGGVTTQGPGAQVILDGSADITIGTAGTGLTLRIRRGGLTGTVVAIDGPETGGLAAGSTSGFSVQGNDTPGEVSGLAYVLTAQQAAATGNGTAVQANLQAVVQGA